MSARPGLGVGAGFLQEHSSVPGDVCKGSHNWRCPCTWRLESVPRPHYGMVNFCRVLRELTEMVGKSGPMQGKARPRFPGQILFAPQRAGASGWVEVSPCCLLGSWGPSCTPTFGLGLCGQKAAKKRGDKSLDQQCALSPASGPD